MYLPLANETIVVVFDPRPRKYRNRPGYQDTFRNIWLNNQSVNKFPVSQLQHCWYSFWSWLFSRKTFRNMAEKCQYNKLLTQILQNLKKKLVAKELIPYGRLRGAREFTPQILAESANVQKEQMRINLLVVWLNMSPKSMSHPYFMANAMSL